MAKFDTKLLIPKSDDSIRNYRHGHKTADHASPEYVVWNGMRARCNNPQNPNYPRYGGRGIKVCKTWNADFVAFLQDMGLRPSLKHSIERINNDGNYTKDNCRWATQTEQCNNRRSSRWLTVDGKEKTMADWSRVSGISISTIHARLKAGWSHEKSVFFPLCILASKNSKGRKVKSRIYSHPQEKFDEVGK